MWKFPLQIPANRKVLVTQGYKSKELQDFYASQGLKIDQHNAIDVVCGTNRETYGTPVVCPFPKATILRSHFGTAVGSTNDNNNFIQIGYTEGATRYEVGGLHLSEIVEKPVGYVFKEGEEMAYLGNAGTITPAPTIGNPYAGAHAHISFFINGIVQDPLQFLNITNPFIGPDSSWFKDLPPIRWAIAEAQKAIDKLKSKPVDN